MRKAVIIGLAAVVILAGGCAHLKKKPAGAQVVEHKNADVTFTCYKTTVKVKATPQQVEDYILDVQHLSAKVGEHRFKMLSNKKMQKLGDMVDFREELAGVTINGKFILVYYKPGEEVWYLERHGRPDVDHAH